MKQMCILLLMFYDLSQKKKKNHHCKTNIFSFLPSESKMTYLLIDLYVYFGLQLQLIEGMMVSTQVLIRTVQLLAYFILAIFAFGNR